MLRAACLGCAFALLAPVAHAQLIPDRTYYGVGRPVPMQVRIPEGTPAGQARIELHEASWITRREARPGEVRYEPTPAVSEVEPGPVNLAALFPSLWLKDARVRYAQLVVGGAGVGPPVVLAPMRSPSRAMLYQRTSGKVYAVDPATGRETFDPREGEIIYTPDPPAFSGLIAWADVHVVFDTTLGEVEFRMRPDEAPNTVRNFIDLVRGGFYTDVIFHRVVARTASGDPFVVQVGDPTGEGSGTPGFAIDLEPSNLPHDFGVLSMARDADPNTNGSQVFICLSRAGTARLDGKYTAFARAVSGADTIIALASVRVRGERPIEPPVLRSARLVDAPPLDKLPRWVERPPEVRESR